MLANLQIVPSKDSRSDLLTWLGDQLLQCTNVAASQVFIRKVEHCGNGVPYALILPSLLPMPYPPLVLKVKVPARHEFEAVTNLKLIAEALQRNGIPRPSVLVDETSKLIKGAYQANLTFLQWFRGLHDALSPRPLCLPPDDMSIVSTNNSSRSVGGCGGAGESSPLPSMLPAPRHLCLQHSMVSDFCETQLLQTHPQSHLDGRRLPLDASCARTRHSRSATVSAASAPETREVTARTARISTKTSHKPSARSPPPMKRFDSTLRVRKTTTTTTTITAAAVPHSVHSSTQSPLIAAAADSNINNNNFINNAMISNMNNCSSGGTSPLWQPCSSPLRFGPRGSPRAVRPSPARDNGAAKKAPNNNNNNNMHHNSNSNSSSGCVSGVSRGLHISTGLRSSPSSLRAMRLTPSCSMNPALCGSAAAAAAAANLEITTTSTYVATAAASSSHTETMENMETIGHRSIPTTMSTTASAYYVNNKRTRTHTDAGSFEDNSLLSRVLRERQFYYDKLRAIESMVMPFVQGDGDSAIGSVACSLLDILYAKV